MIHLDAAAARFDVERGLVFSIFFRSGGNQLLLANTCLGDGVVHLGGHLRIGLGKVELPVGADQFVAEIRPPRLQGGLRQVIGFDRVGPHDQKRVGFLFVEQVGLRSRPDTRARAQRRGQRIAGAQWPLKVGFRKHDAFRLQDHCVLAAFQIDRPAVGAERTFVGHDRVLDRFAGRTALGVGDRLFGGAQLSAQPLEFGGGRNLLGLLLRPQAREFGHRPTQSVGAVAQAPQVVFHVAQFEPRRVQVGLRLVARLLELTDPPVRALRGRSRQRRSPRRPRRRRSALARKSNQQSHQCSGRANEDRQQRKQPDASGR